MTPPGRLHDDDVFVPHVGWVSAQCAAEPPFAIVCQTCHDLGYVLVDEHVVDSILGTRRVKPCPTCSEVAS